ncbi:MAG TPA: copper chaperone PCu(A)C [Gemmatimonadales bacterium]|nr:copper chaperone PCu(A)C [Gemmatimonadales bacterium]
MSPARQRGGSAVLLLGIMACQQAAPVATATAGDLRITRAFAYEPIIQASGAAYFTVKNTGAVPDTLLGVSSPASVGAMLHGGSMAHLSVIEIPAGGTLVLKSGDTHVMLSDFITMPHAGDSLPLTLQFAHAGRVDLKLPVRKYGE